MLTKLFRLIFKTTQRERKILIKDNLMIDEQENLTRACRLLKKTDLNMKDSCIIDVGAFDGNSSLTFSKIFPDTNILGFEANPQAYQTAKNNTSKHSKIELHHTAISNKNEKMTFYVTSNKVSSSLNKLNHIPTNSADYKKELDVIEKVEVEARKLDEFTKNKKVALLKVDTQGHELEVLEGSKQTLMQTRFVLIEMSNHNIYAQGCKYYEVDEWLRKHNFLLLFHPYETHG